MSHVVVYRVVGECAEDEWVGKRCSYARKYGFSLDLYSAIFEKDIEGFDVRHVFDIEDTGGFDGALCVGDVVEVDGQCYYVDPAWLVLLDN